MAGGGGALAPWPFSRGLRSQLGQGQWIDRQFFQGHTHRNKFLAQLFPLCAPTWLVDPSCPKWIALAQGDSLVSSVG
eukprot:3103470-Amphidinium_carterae.1